MPSDRRWNASNGGNHATPWSLSLPRAVGYWSKGFLLRTGGGFDEEPDGVREGGSQRHNVARGQYDLRRAGFHHEDYVRHILNRFFH